MKLEDITKDMVLTGILSGTAVKVVTVEPSGDDAITVYYKTDDGRLGEQMLFRSNEADLQPIDIGRPWSLDAKPEDFRLGAEALRIHLAHLFDPLMAIHTSNVDPLPHQITAVYEEMLNRQPLRFVLADDPGAGKTIMSGLLIRELMVRGDLERCLIICPGSLVDQWQDELDRKFNLSFEIFSRDMVESSPSANPFAEKNFLIARIDQLSRAEDLQEKLLNTEWDLIVVDEAHKMSASYFGNEMKTTKRYQLGEKLGAICRHFLLMTATPHNGKEEDFQAFMALIDSDRFYGKNRDGSKVDTSDLMRRMVKEELVKFDGTPLFPERIAETVNYRLSNLEAALYEKVTAYVTEEMGRAEKLDGKRKGNVGFALTILQRRLASSPEAIFQSLQRRFKRLESMLREARLSQRGLSALGQLDGISVDEETDIDDLYDDLPEAELLELENRVVDQATAAQTVSELEAEIGALQNLVADAKQVRLSGEDHKWNRLAELLEENEQMRDQAGNRRKIIIFTEHKDTLNYLHDRISGLLGTEGAVEVIHGGVKREERRKAVERFTNYDESIVLLATDAAGEGVNLQVAHLMVNYDLPWNPNRLEQRFGRIHRIGQTEVCRLWNMVASETREGDVFHRLFDKIEQERQALGGKVFDVLGEVFSETPLRDLLLEAIRYNDLPETRAKLFEKIDATLSREHFEQIIAKGAIACDHLATSRVFELKEEMEKASALRLQPFFIAAFFSSAFERLGGTLKRREGKRYEISHVPSTIRERDRQIGTGAPALKKYHRICFEKDQIRLADRSNSAMASLVAPGHPLMDATVDLMLERHRPTLKQGAVLVDRMDFGTTARMLFIIDHSVKDGVVDRKGNQRVISRKLQFVTIDAEGKAANAGPAPYLDLDAPTAEELSAVDSVIEQEWLDKDLEKLALGYASNRIVPDHYEEVRNRRIRRIESTLEAVHSRLTVEINYWSHRYTKLKAEVEAGKQPRMQPENARRRAEELTSRLESRTKDLKAQLNVVSSTPIVVGGALVLPQGLLDQVQGNTPDPQQAASTKAMEMIGMNAVMAYERSIGYEPRDVSEENLGWDITSTNDRGDCRFVEVKARHQDGGSVYITRNEMLVGFNKQGDGWFLAVAQVDDDGRVRDLHYIEQPFSKEPDPENVRVERSISDLISNPTARRVGP